jgi:hypothetical protein
MNYCHPSFRSGGVSRPKPRAKLLTPKEPGITRTRPLARRPRRFQLPTSIFCLEDNPFQELLIRNSMVRLKSRASSLHPNQALALVGALRIYGRVANTNADQM